MQLLQSLLLRPHQQKLPRPSRLRFDIECAAGFGPPFSFRLPNQQDLRAVIFFVERDCHRLQP